MYTEYFGLTEKPFSISPDPRYLYLSQRHADALAHLIYGISESGGFIQLTGEVGTGKTTLIRSLLEQLPDKTEIALVLNPPLTTLEFLASICQELRIELPGEQTTKALIDRLNETLLAAHAEDRRVVLIVDEAQTLSPELLEQIRLLTNLETSKRKLLQIILIGQPELREMLDRPEMRQVAQRITGRYHLRPLSAHDARVYIRHRMRVAGSRHDVFTERAMRRLYRLSGGIPRLINVIADRALLAAYTRDERHIGARLVSQAAREVYGRTPALRRAWLGATVATVVAGSAAGFYFWAGSRQLPEDLSSASAVTGKAGGTPATSAGSGSGSTATGANAAGAPGAPAGATAESATSPGSAPFMRLSEFLAVNAAFTDEASAAATLFSLWGDGYPPGRSQGCEYAAASGLRCLAFTDSTLHDLRQIDRPMVVELVDADGRVNHVVLAGLGYDYAELYAGRASARVSIADLTHYWFGTHWLLWRPQTDIGEPLRPGMRSERVIWVREALGRVFGDEAVSPSPAGETADDPAYFDPALEGRVRDYQLSRRLQVDGIVGRRTQIALQTELGHPAGPTLIEVR